MEAIGQGRAGPESRAPNATGPFSQAHLVHPSPVRPPGPHPHPWHLWVPPRHLPSRPTSCPSAAPPNRARLPPLLSASAGPVPLSLGRSPRPPRRCPRPESRPVRSVSPSSSRGVSAWPVSPRQPAGTFCGFLSPQSEVQAPGRAGLLLPAPSMPKPPSRRLGGAVPGDGGSGWSWTRDSAPLDCGEGGPGMAEHRGTRSGTRETQRRRLSGEAWGPPGGGDPGSGPGTRGRREAAPGGRGCGASPRPGGESLAHTPLQEEAALTTYYAPGPSILPHKALTGSLCYPCFFKCREPRTPGPR